MSRLGKTIISLISAGIVAICGILLYVFWPAITGTINKNKYYTSEDVQSSYDKGFNDGNKSETELTAEITYYKTIVDEYEAEVNSLNKEISDLLSLKNRNEASITELTSIKNENESTISILQNNISKNKEEIDGYKAQISTLNLKITTLQNSNTNYQAEINNLRNQISNYQTMINQLQNTNNMNVQTINTLNNQVTSLNRQISELQFEINNNSDDVVELQQTIKELQKSIQYYESYIAELENELQVVATFEYDGSVYNIQIVNKGSNVSVVTPDSTGKIVFNGWMVNDEIVDLSTYQIITNTKFVASITYRNQVSFISNGSSVQEIFVEDGQFATAPEVSRGGYEFDGWTVDGNTIVDVSTYPITKDTTFTAVYTKIHTITFVYEDDVIETQEVRNGEYADFINVENTTYKQFNGWMINGAIVDVSNYKISSSVVFTANITYSYDVNFIVDDEVYNSQIVIENNFVLVPNNPKKDSYVFDGWSIDGEIIDLTTYRITSNTNLIAMFTYSPAGLFNDEGVMTMSWDEIVENNYLTVSEDGELAQGANTERKTMLSGNLVIPSSVKYTTAASGNNKGTFSGCTNLKSIKFSEGVEDVGNYTFYGCSRLTNIELPNTVHTIRTGAFQNTGLVGFKLPDSITTLGVCLFNYCDNFKYVYIPQTVSNFGMGLSINYNFSDLSSAFIILCEANEKPEGWAENFNQIEPDVLAPVIYGCSNLIVDDSNVYCYVGEQKVFVGHTNKDSEHISIDNDVEIIAEKACYGYSKLKTIDMPESLISINKQAFLKCTSLTEIYLGEYVDVIDDEAFSDCKALAKVTINSAITNVDYYAFLNVTANVYVDSIESWLGTTFYGLHSNPSYKTGVIYFNNESLVDIVVPEYITKISKYAFYKCSTVNSIICHDNVTSIGEGVCSYSTSIKKFVTGNNVTLIPREAFNRSSLEEIKLGNKVRSLAYNCFAYCKSLRKIFLPLSVTSIYCTTVASAPFYESYVNIYCEAESVPSGFDKYWNMNTTTSTFSTYWGYTYEEYVTKTGATL